ncbi:WXG100 family type VII secretion target [Nocardia miyunensis]|uniref:WXG100 family type VII secretion target n=1 Tax=Nocardia miyunensis TaxID=282684 RepID=UPI00083706A8|nr:WXG100 family type VII secretion target [Nocardia miyunensis]
MSGDGGNPELSIVPDDVTALGKYAYDLAEILRSALTNAGREVDALTGKNWSGAAAASFAEGWAETQDGGGKIIDALTTMASSLGVTAKSYVAQDNQFAGEVSSLDLP